MFFLMGINNGRKDLDFNQTIVCKLCGRFGRYQVFMTYTVLSLFFIPVIKWNRRYYVQTSCCNTLYELEPEVGRAIAHGQEVEIQPEYLTRIYTGGSRYDYKHCPNCGYETAEDFEFCPKCGNRF